MEIFSVKKAKTMIILLAKAKAIMEKYWEGIY